MWAGYSWMLNSTCSHNSSFVARKKQESCLRTGKWQLLQFPYFDGNPIVISGRRFGLRDPAWQRMRLLINLSHTEKYWTLLSDSSHKKLCFQLESYLHPIFSIFEWQNDVGEVLFRLQWSAEKAQQLWDLVWRAAKSWEWLQAVPSFILGRFVLFFVSSWPNGPSLCVQMPYKEIEEFYFSCDETLAALKNKSIVFSSVSSAFGELQPKLGSETLINWLSIPNSVPLPYADLLHFQQRFYHIETVLSKTRRF